MRYLPCCRRFVALPAGLAALALLAVPAFRADSSPPAPGARKVDFVKDVQPIFAKNCTGCHGETKQKADLRLDFKSSLMKSGAVVPGKSAASPLIQRITSPDPDKRMPFKGPALTADQIAILRAWIDQGAVWPDAASAVVRQDHWSYRPLLRPAVPAVKNPSWVRTPVDAFVLAKLEEKGMTPSAPADRRTLLRRLSFDLIGQIGRAHV